MKNQKKINRFICGGLTLILVLSAFTSNAQYQLNGTAVQTSPDSYRLTSDVQWQTGSLWYIKQLDLNNSFDLMFELYFGNHDDGADGITFTLQRQGINAGEPGGGMGATNISPSVIIEYDTYQNTINPWDATDYKDPAYDHITVGIDSFAADHSKAANQLTSPVAAMVGNGNIEDGQWHSTRVKWNAASKTLEVYFDCVLRTSYTGDLLSNVFAGNPLVYYGFTAATGGATNEQSMRGFHFGSTQTINKAICIGDSVQVDISGDQNYSWLPNTNISDPISPKPFLFPTTSTQYIATVSNCYLSWNDTVNVTVNNLPTPNLVDQAICLGDPAATFDAGLYTSYQWSANGTGTNRTTSGTTPGNYTVQVTDANGCKASATGVLTVNALPVAPIIPNQKICLGDAAVTFDAGVGYNSYLWSVNGTGNSNTTSGSTAGSYTCTVSDINGCKASTTAVLTVNPLPVPTISDKSICVGGAAATFDAGAGFSNYSWSGLGAGNSQTTSGSVAGNYTCTVTDINGCIASKTGVLTVNALPAKPTIANQEICAETSTSFDAGAGYTSYLWSGNGTGNTRTTSAKNAGNYTCTVSNAAGCKNSATAVLTVNALPTITLGKDTTICDNNFDKINLVGTTSVVGQIQWSTFETNVKTIQISKAGNYWVSITDAKSCESSDTIAVASLCNDFKLDWPNVITANGDGVNDEFRPKFVDESNYDYVSANVNVKSFLVYDRWGLLMFNSYEDILPRWDGTSKGSTVAPGTYYYIVKYSVSSGKNLEATGYITVL
ncbi:MAG: gliding motility-associated C-terminal domain-containing protein [Bacteroidetes bacterium]|nr:gliding motility-associated C-terminal domain-containing protein [Bacteroidota bacterium]